MCKLSLSLFIISPRFLGKYNLFRMQRFTNVGGNNNDDGGGYP
jgi:hypothetical protein